MKCALGTRKIRKIEKLTGKKVRSAWVRGGWKHFWAMVAFEGEDYKGMIPPFVNYRTGEILSPEPFNAIKNTEYKIKITKKQYEKEYKKGWNEADKLLNSGDH